MTNEKRFAGQITLDEMETEIKRELAMRNRVYPQWIMDNKLKPTTAAFRVVVLEAILILIQKEIRRTAPQGDLFG